jgi:hypothetical protein
VIARNVPVGPGPDEYLRTVEVLAPTAEATAAAGKSAAAAAAAAAAGSSAKGPPVVLLPGYGAGAAFFWR